MCCGVERMRDMCSDSAPSFTQPTYKPTGSLGSFCMVGDVCGHCTVTLSLAEACFVVRSASSVAAQWETDTTRQSCEFPFSEDGHIYRPIPPDSPVIVSVRASGDPFVVLEALTAGSKEIGPVDQQDFIIGRGFVILGSMCLFTLVCFVMCLCCCCREHFTEDTVRGAVSFRTSHS